MSDIKIEVNGVPYRNFMSASVEIRLDALSNTFSFQAGATKQLPFALGDECVILVDDEKVLSGHIEIIDGNVESSSYTLSLNGRDKTGDIVDSTLGELSDIRPPISLKSIIEKVLKNISSGLSVIDNVNPDIFNKAEDLLAPEVGDNAFQFIEKFARKRQVLLSSNADGNIEIISPSGTFVNYRLQHLVDNDSNNVLRSSFSYDNTGRYNVYKFLSGGNPLSLNFGGGTGLDNLVSQKGYQVDSDIRTGRQLVAKSESSYSNEENRKRALWEANVRKTRGRVYSATVEGYRDFDDNLFAVNTVVPVLDELAGINAHMLINTVSFQFNNDDGPVTTLSLVEENAYKLTVSEPVKQEFSFGSFT